MISPPLDVQAASRLANNVRLRDITCIQLEAKHIGVVEPRPNVSFSWDSPEPTAVWHLDEDGLRAVFPLRLTIDAVEGDGGDAPKTRIAELGVVMRVDYEMKPGGQWADSDIPHYVGITGFMHVWPYFRTEVQWLTMKLGLPPLVLPVIVSGHPQKRVSVSRITAGATATAAKLPAKTKKKRGTRRSPAP
jgi:hypothetical protein